MYEGRNLIGGSWQAAQGKATFEQRNPARLGEITGRFADSSIDDVRSAIAAAQSAFASWRERSPQARKSILSRALENIRRNREPIAESITRENGKTLAESRSEVDSAIGEMDYQIAQGLRLYGQTVPVESAGTLAYSTRVPLGPVGIVTPWNFPFNVPVRKCVPALMAGNTVVFKPASLTPRAGLLFAQALDDAGVPGGVVNCVTGGGSVIGNAIVEDPRIRAISFTGSTAVGRLIQQQAAKNLTATQLELGGKNPAIVLPDADIESAVADIVKGAFACAGQWCTSTSRVIVHEDIADRLTDRLVQAIASLRLGDGFGPDTDIGPVCGTSQKADVFAWIERGIGEGARVRIGGQAVNVGPAEDGCYVEPTLFDRVTPEMSIAREEIFGPVVVVIAVHSFEEAVHVANDVAYGLSSSIFTRDLQAALTFMERSDVGLAHVNLMSALKEPQLPFGGTKDSGAGPPEAGAAGIEFFSKSKVCYVRYR